MVIENNKIIFMGTPEFAAIVLKELIKSSFNNLAVITKPDKPQFRSKMLVESKVKVVAIENKLPIFQPKGFKKRKTIEYIQKLKPDLIVVVAYGRLLPKEILDIPKFGCINLHASLLPHYRGAAPINWAIINGEKTTGVTVQKISQELDAGDVLSSASVEIMKEDDANSLYSKLSNLGSSLLIETIKRIMNGSVVGKPQDPKIVSYAPILKKEDGWVSWEMSSDVVYNRIRGLVPWPVAYTTLDGKLFKIYKAILKHGKVDALIRPGSVSEITSEGICVQCGQGLVVLTEVQIENRKKMSAVEFSRGYRLEKGIVFGEEKNNE